MHLKATRITQNMAVLPLRLAFHTEEPDRVSDAVNIFMLPDLSLIAGLEKAMIELR